MRYDNDIIVITAYNAHYAQKTHNAFMQHLQQYWQVGCDVAFYNPYHAPHIDSNLPIQYIHDIGVEGYKTNIDKSEHMRAYAMRMLCVCDALLRFKHKKYIIWLDNDIFVQKNITNDMLADFLPKDNQLLTCVANNENIIEPALLCVNNPLATTYKVPNLIHHFLQQCVWDKVDDSAIWGNIIHQCDLQKPIFLHNIYPYDSFTLTGNVLLNPVNSSLYKEYFYHAKGAIHKDTIERIPDSIDDILLYNHDTYTKTIAQYSNPAYKERLLEEMHKKRATHSYEKQT